MKKQLPTTHRMTLALPLLFLASCTGGGGNGEGPALNAASYSPDNFDYEDPHAYGFHPLGTSGTVLNQRAEMMFVLPYDHGSSVGGGGEDETLTWIYEGPTEGDGPVDGSLNLFGENVAMRGAAAGNLDDDAADEWVAVAITHGGFQVTLYSGDRQQDGSVQVETILSFDLLSQKIKDASVQMADVDGDFRDEIIVVARSNFFESSSNNAVVRVFDDPEHGALNMLTMYRTSKHMDLHGLPADVDGDGRPEVLVTMTGDTTYNGRQWLRLYDLAEGESTMKDISGWHELTGNSATASTHCTVGDFDGDGKDEVATGHVAKPQIGFSGVLALMCHEWRDGTFKQLGELAVLDYDLAGDGLGDWTIGAFDRRVGQDEVAILGANQVPWWKEPWTATVFSFNAVQKTWSQVSEELGLPNNTPGNTPFKSSPVLAAGDLDADGAEELLWTVLRRNLTNVLLRRGYLKNGIEGEGGGEWRPLSSHVLDGDAKTLPPVMVCGDWDADGLVVEYTGVKRFTMARPIPLAVLSAPPTRSGISQNYGDTTTRFATGMTTSESWGVTAGTTIAGSVGAELDIFGLIKVGGKVTIEEAIQTSELETSQVSFVQGYSGSYANDTIIFEGTLQHSYEYLIRSAPDPDAVGQYITLNVPVDSQTYNWTLDYYNSQMEPADRIGADIMTHKPGKLSSYPSFHELEEMVSDSLHWQHPGQHEVGQGLGSNDLEIAFLNEQTTETQRTVSVGGEGEVGIGVSVGGASSSTSGSVYSISYSEETSFAATVGKIETAEDYEASLYTWGMFVETYGRTADDNNNPTGYLEGRRPFQLVRYWVE